MRQLTRQHPEFKTDKILKKIQTISILLDEETSVSFIFVEKVEWFSMNAWIVVSSSAWNSPSWLSDYLSKNARFSNNSTRYVYHLFWIFPVLCMRQESGCLYGLQSYKAMKFPPTVPPPPPPLHHKCSDNTTGSHFTVERKHKLTTAWTHK